MAMQFSKEDQENLKNDKSEIYRKRTEETNREDVENLSKKGKAGLLIGLGGFICIIISGIGFLAAWASLHQENIRPLFPTIASVVNGLSVVFYFVLYIYGMIL